MKARKTADRGDARARHDRLIETAARTELSLTDGLREMRAISGLTQEQFAQHREVSTRVIKALELGQGNPTVATLNRIAAVFGLEVAFVPRKPLKGQAKASSPSELADALIQMEAAIAEQQVLLKNMISKLQTSP